MFCNEYDICYECNGIGKVMTCFLCMKAFEKGIEEYQQCENCEYLQPCLVCDGEGWIENEEEVSHE